MTAADTLDAAYAALETARADVESEMPWVYDEEDTQVQTPLGINVIPDQSGVEWGPLWNPGDGRLVAMLARTIDAQLLIIRAAYDKAVGPYSVLEEATVERLLAGPLALARAILAVTA